MKLFLSYPSAERTLADRLALALEAEGHEVFFDRSDLAAGEAFHQRLRDAIQTADAMIFLVTPSSVAAGSYTLAELDIARARWRRPAGHLLPVLVAPTPMAALPPYLAAVTVLQPRGELVAETVAAVVKLSGADGSRGRRLVIAGGLVLLLLGGIALAATQWIQQRAAQAVQQHDEAAAAQALQLCNDGSHEPALQRLNELALHRPPAPAVAALREDCAMRWTREMRATSGDQLKLTFDQQVALVQPVLLQGLVTARGARAADLRAHIGWGEFLRRREGTGSADPVPHWQRALADDADNVYAHAMWANTLLPGGLAEARLHFAKAVASDRDRDYVRRLQFGGTLGGSDEVTAYAVAVADEMRRGGESLSPTQRTRLWNYAFGSRLLDPGLRQAVFAAVPPAALLATFEWLVPLAERRDEKNVLARFDLATLQANAGQREQARAGLQSLERQLRAEHQSGRLLTQTQLALAALGKPAREATAP